MWRFSIRHISSFTQNCFSSGCKLDQEKRDRRFQEFFQNVTGSLRDLKARRFRQQLRAPISTPWEARGLNRCKVCERWPGGSGSLEICEVKFFFGGGFQLKMHECLESHRLVVGVEHLVASFPISSRLVNDWTQVPCTSSVLLLLPAGCPVLWGWCAALTVFISSADMQDTTALVSLQQQNQFYLSSCSQHQLHCKRDGAGAFCKSSWQYPSNRVAMPGAGEPGWSQMRPSKFTTCVLNHCRCVDHNMNMSYPVIAIYWDIFLNHFHSLRGHPSGLHLAEHS